MQKTEKTQELESTPVTPEVESVAVVESSSVETSPPEAAPATEQNSPVEAPPQTTTESKPPEAVSEGVKGEEGFSGLPIEPEGLIQGVCF